MISKKVSQIKIRGQEKDVMDPTATSRIVCNYSVPYGSLQMNVTD